MAQKYKLIERKNLGKDNETSPKKFYAQAVNNGYVSFEELCGDIGEGCADLGRREGGDGPHELHAGQTPARRAHRAVRRDRLLPPGGGIDRLCDGKGFPELADQEAEDRLRTGLQATGNPQADHLRTRHRTRRGNCGRRGGTPGRTVSRGKGACFFRKGCTLFFYCLHLHDQTHLHG